MPSPTAENVAKFRPISRLLKVVLVLLLGWVGWQIIGNTMADTKSIGDPDAALRWRPDLAAPLVAVAEKRLVAAKTDADLAGVADLAKRALNVGPLQAGALRLVGLVADLRGDSAGALSLMELAGQRSWRDTVSQLWLYDQNIHQGQLGAALANLDGVLRTRPDLREKLMPAFAGLAGDAKGRILLIKALADDPPWRPYVFSDLPALAEPSVGFALLEGLEGSAVPPRNSELQPYLRRLIDSGQFELAYLAWLHFLPESRGATISYAYNGDFSSQPSGLPFDWVIGDVPGASTEVVDTGEPDHGPAVRVTFANTRVPYGHLSKLLLLPAGHYRLAGLARAADLINDRGMTWRVYCADGSKQMIAESARMRGNTPWFRFVVDFDVPESGCQAQWLRLELAARVALEQQVGGEIWFDDITVRRQPLPTLAAGGTY